MKIAYQEHWKCHCGHLFYLLIPMYICLFKSEKAKEAMRQHEFAILRHTIAHMEGKLNGQTKTSKARFNTEVY